MADVGPGRIYKISCIISVAWAVTVYKTRLTLDEKLFNRPSPNFIDGEMAEIVIKIPEELEELPEDWSAVALDAIRLRAFELKLKRSKAFRKILLDALDKMLEHSTLTNEDCLRLGREDNSAMKLRIEQKMSETR